MTSGPIAPPSRRSRRWLLRTLITATIVLVLFAGLFALNGLVLADRTTPRARQFAIPQTAPTASGPGEVTIMAYNVAKGFAHKGGMRFEPTEHVEARLRRMAELIRAERPDLVFLSEALTECAPCPVDQVELLAREAGLPYAITGENYNIGVPFVRVVGGNAILSRQPLTPVANIDLIGRRPFYITQNNRRALFASTEIAGQPVLMAALHNDSFDMRNNEAQTQQLLDYSAGRATILAGDFNNRPNDGSIRKIRESGRFGGAFDGPPTFFEGDRKERIDFIFVPRAWELIDHRVIADDVSDHRPVVCRFRMPR